VTAGIPAVRLSKTIADQPSGGFIMSTVTVGKLACECPECSGIRRSVDDALRQVEHVAHKARVLKTIAADAVEARVVETAHRIRKDPFKSVAMAFAIGVPVGALLGWVFGHAGNEKHT
jgi:ElaB/YqjD/DUF883 family membrane-anchored ribosome-binding protein